MKIGYIKRVCVSGSARGAAVGAAGIAAAILLGFIPHRTTNPPSVNVAPPSRGAPELNSAPAGSPLPQVAPARQEQERARSHEYSRPQRAERLSPPETAEGLIAQLVALDLNKGITRENAQRWNETLKQLIAQGPTAIPAIRAFLERNEDLEFGLSQSSTLMDYRSVRTGLLDALKQIGGPEAIEAALDVLKKTADPWEVAVLSRDLEEQAPGQFRQEALTAARESLAMAGAGDLGEREVAPLFQVLQSYGDASVIPDLKAALPQYSYYASLALAHLPEGQGISVLIEQLRDPISIAEGQADIALQILAQVAPAQPDASEAIIEMAQANRINDLTWSAVALALAGHNFEMGVPLRQPSATQKRGVNPQAPVMGEDGQSLFTTPATASWLDEQINPRLAIIDQLLAVNNNPAATQALQEARESLQQKATELSMLPR